MQRIGNIIDPHPDHGYCPVSFIVGSHSKSCTEIIVIDYACKPDGVHSAELYWSVAGRQICWVPIVGLDGTVGRHYSSTHSQRTSSDANVQKIIAVDLLGFQVN